ncbi:hypothetical protein BJ165DRAFT_1398367 [Panaeolus papilionaceus]|nr:hypothetical protein BJ165DRAFT_1398367 [Panaeolus papilionaceus]
MWGVEEQGQVQQNSEDARSERETAREREREIKTSTSTRTRLSKPAPAPTPEPSPKPLLKADTCSFFFISLTPAAIPTVLIDTTLAIALDSSIAPDAVSTSVRIIEKRRVGGNGQGEDGEAGKEGEEEQEEGIEYLDYDDVRGIARYFDVAPNLNAPLRRTACKNSARRMSIRWWCFSAHNSFIDVVHSFANNTDANLPQVPDIQRMQRTLYTLMSNHQTSIDARGVLRDQDCDLCFSSFHKTKECPTWWWIYEYFSKARRHATLARRLEKGLLSGKGDVMKSPFWNPTSESQHKKSESATKPRRVDDYVGKKATVEVRLVLQKREERVDEYEHDWFGTRKNADANAKKKNEQGSLLARLEVQSGNDFARIEKGNEKRVRGSDSGRQSGGRGNGGG